MQSVANDAIANPLEPASEQRLIRWLWAGASGVGAVLMRVAQVGVLVWIILSAVLSAFVRMVKRLWAIGLAVIRFGRDAGVYLTAKPEELNDNRLE